MIAGESFIGHDHVVVGIEGEVVDAVCMGNKGHAFILENLSAQDVIPMPMAVDHILDRLVGDLSDLFAHHRCRCRINGVGGDHPIVGDDKDVAEAAMAERVQTRFYFDGVESTQAEDTHVRGFTFVHFSCAIVPLVRRRAILIVVRILLSIVVTTLSCSR